MACRRFIDFVASLPQSLFHIRQGDLPLLVIDLLNTPKVVPKSNQLPIGSHQLHVNRVCNQHLSVRLGAV